jgi:hypothetical protein
MIPNHVVFVTAAAFFARVVAGFRERDRDLDREREGCDVARVARRRTPRSSAAAMSSARL